MASGVPKFARITPILAGFIFGWSGGIFIIFPAICIFTTHRFDFF